jgi:HD superfamily phosphodiesterase
MDFLKELLDNDSVNTVKRTQKKNITTARCVIRRPGKFVENDVNKEDSMHSYRYLNY